DRRTLLADGAVDADQVFAFRVDDRVEGDRGLAGLAVPDDQLALTAADRDHRVDRLDTGGHRLTHGLALDHARSDALDRQEFFGIDRAFVVDGLAESIHDAADQRFTNGHGHDATGALGLVAFFDLGVVAHEHCADLVFFQVHGDAGDVVSEVDHLAGHDLVEPVDAGDAVAERDDGADLVDLHLRFVVLDLLADELCDFVCLNSCHLYSSLRRGRRGILLLRERGLHSFELTANG